MTQRRFYASREDGEELLKAMKILNATNTMGMTEKLNDFFPEQLGNDGEWRDRYRLALSAKHTRETAISSIDFNEKLQRFKRSFKVTNVDIEKFLGLEHTITARKISGVIPWTPQEMKDLDEAILEKCREELEDTYAETIRKAMGSKRQKQESLAEVLSCTPTSLSRQMTGKNRWPSEHLAALEKYFGIKFKALSPEAKTYHDSLPLIKSKKSSPVIPVGSEDAAMRIIVSKYLREHPELLEELSPKSAKLRKLEYAVRKDLVKYKALLA